MVTMSGRRNLHALSRDPRLPCTTARSPIAAPGRSPANAYAMA